MGDWREPAVQVQQLQKRFGQTLALDGVSFTVRSGTVLGLLGPNGAGKTTVVRILATLLGPDGGHAWVDGHDVVEEAQAVRRRIGLTGQYASVDEKLTGRENLLLIGRLLGLSRRQSRDRADELLQEFSLTEAAHRPVATYSGGMRRRLDLGASLVGRPRILFLDEPTTGLDPRARLDLWDLIRRLVAEGTTVLLTTQYLEEADALADDLVVIDQGRVIAEGTPAELKRRIGAQALVVTATTQEDVASLRECVASVTGRRPEVDGRRVTTPLSDPALLTTIVRALDERGLVVEEVMLRGASLDDVFLSLTGRHVPEEESEEEGAA